MWVHGIAKSIVNKEKYSNEEVFRKDKAVMGSMSMMHNKVLTKMPKEIVDHYTAELECEGLNCNTEADSIPSSEYCSTSLV